MPPAGDGQRQRDAAVSPFIDTEGTAISPVRVGRRSAGSYSKRSGLGGEEGHLIKQARYTVAARADSPDAAAIWRDAGQGGGADVSGGIGLGTERSKFGKVVEGKR